MGIFDGYNFDPQNYGGGGILSQLLAGLNLPQQTPSGGFAPIQPPTDVSAVNRHGTPGVTLPQQADSGFGQQGGGGNPLTGLFSGLGNGLGSLFGGGGPQAPGGPQMPQQAPQMAQQAPQQQAPGLMDRLGAGWMGLGHGGLTSAIGGLLTGQRQDPQGLLERALVQRGVSPDMARAGIQNPQLLPTLLAEQGQGATYQALVQAGLPAGIAQAAALNPEVLKTIAPQLYSKPQFTQIGEDQFGAKQYGFIQPDKMSVTPAGAAEAGGAVAAPGGSGSFLAPGVKQIDSQLAGDAYLKQFSPEVQSAVQAYVDGRAMPTGNPRKGFTQTIKQIAQKYGQDVGLPADDTTFGARSAMRRNLSTAAPNSLGGQINIGNTAIGHLEDLSQKALDLGNWDIGIAPLSHVINDARGLGSGQAAKMEALKAAAQHYGQEITKFYAGSPGGEGERNRFLTAVGSAKTPQELAAVISTEAELAHSRIQALESQIRGTLGDRGAEQYPVVRPETKKSLERIGGNVERLRGNAAPNQQPAQQSSPTVPQADLMAEARRRGLIK